ncbi:hypothetical protein Zm00014a_012805, partial [Zea mays]
DITPTPKTVFPISVYLLDELRR